MLGRGFDGFPLIEADDRAVGDIDFFDDWVTHSARDAYWQAIDGDEPRRDASGARPADGRLVRSVSARSARRLRAHPARRRARTSRLRRGLIDRTVGARGNRRRFPERSQSELPARKPRAEHSLVRSSPPIARCRRGADAPVRLYVMGANVWRDEQEWPLARARETAWYLRSGGHANSASGDGRLTTEAPDQDDPPDIFVSNPASPVPTRGGAMLGESGTVPQNDVEQRSDVLVYSTPPLAEDVEVTGPVSAILYVATSSPSADFTAKLVDVHPDGVAYNVSDGIIRRAYQPEAVPAAAEPTEITIALWPTSMVFRRGHRIRLEIAGSNFPRFDRNPNTGEPRRNRANGRMRRRRQCITAGRRRRGSCCRSSRQAGSCGMSGHPVNSA